MKAAIIRPAAEPVLGAVDEEAASNWLLNGFEKERSSGDCASAKMSCYSGGLRQMQLAKRIDAQGKKETAHELTSSQKLG